MKRAAQAVERDVVGRTGLQHVPTRQLQVGDALAIRHEPIVAGEPPATEGNEPAFLPLTTVDSTSAPLRLVQSVDVALSRIGWSDKDAARAMGISAALWSKQKNGVDNCHIQLDRLALLPPAFHREFVGLYSREVGMSVAHASVAERLMVRVGDLLAECGLLYRQLQVLVQERDR